MASQDMKAAERTYGYFISLVKWTIPIVALIAATVVIIISN
jgi:hypothetical protein